MVLFPKKINVGGEIILDNIPQNYGHILSIAFFKINNKNDAPPYGTEPEEKYLKDLIDVINDVNLSLERNDKSIIIPFELSKNRGIYYLQIRAIIFRKNGERVIAQTEQFFFGKRPLEISSDIVGLELPISWPSIPIENLNKYGEIKPKR